MNQINNHGTSLPHHRLLAYKKSLELLAAVRAAQIRDTKLKDEALRAAKGSCLNIAEGAAGFRGLTKLALTPSPAVSALRPSPLPKSPVRLVTPFQNMSPSSSNWAMSLI